MTLVAAAAIPAAAIPVAISIVVPTGCDTTSAAISGDAPRFAPQRAIPEDQDDSAGQKPKSLHVEAASLLCGAARIRSGNAS